jgi:hypothetical protein
MSWYVCGANAIAVSDGREPLDVGVEQLGQCFRLGIAQLRELLGGGLYGAVMLAELGAGGDRVNRGRVTLGRERSREIAGVSCFSGGALEAGAHPLGKLRGAAAGELSDRILTAVLGQETERTRRQFVVRGRSSSMTGIGERVVLGRPPATPLGLGGHPRGARADGSGGAHGVEMTADCRR